MWALALTAKTFSSRPSELLAVDDPVVALMVDLAAAKLLLSPAKEEESRNQICL